MRLKGEIDYRRYRRYFLDLGRLYQKKKTRVYTGIVLSLFTVAFFSFFAIKPTVVTIAKLIKEIKDKKEVVKKLDQKIEALGEAQINYSQMAGNLSLIEEALPPSPRLSLLLGQIEAISQQAGVRIKGVKFSETELGSGKKGAVEFSLFLGGSYPEVRRFLELLGEWRRSVFLEGLIFKTEPGGEEALTLSLKIKAFFLPKDEAIQTR